MLWLIQRENFWVQLNYVTAQNISCIVWDIKDVCKEPGSRAGQGIFWPCPASADCHWPHLLLHTSGTTCFQSQLQSCMKEELQNQKIIDSWNSLGWKRPRRSSSSKSFCGLEHLPQIAQSLIQSLNTSRAGISVAPLVNPFQCLTTLRVKNYFLISNLNLMSFSVKPLSIALSLYVPVMSLSPVLL